MTQTILIGWINITDMKDQFLKLAGVKSDKEFYKLFPDEASFMAKYGKQIKKLNLGDSLSKLAGNNAFATGVQSAGDIIGGIQQMKDEKQMMLGAQQMQGVSDIALQASMTRPEQVQKKYVRPEDNMNTGEEFFPVYGVGTTLAKNGTKIGYGQNGFLANLGNKDFMKFNKSGQQTDIFNFAEQGGGDMLSKVTSGIGSPKGYGVSGAGKIGGGIGATAGMLVGGPVGAMLGKAGGQLIGNLVDRKAEKTEKANEAIADNIQKMTLNQGAQSLQNQNYAFMRTGGNIRNNIMSMGGDLETHWGGYAEPISYNPYLPNDGETVMFRGQSHDDSDGYGNTGIGITYGENPVEVERGEPALQLKNGTDGSSNLTVYGNLKIPKYGIDLLGDQKAKGKKFKNYVSDLSKVEKKQNNLVEQSTDKLNNLEINDEFDKLSLNSYKSNILGANQKLKDIADKKIKAANLQSAINDTAEEYGLVADDLAKGKIKKARMGASILKKAQNGIVTDADYDKAMKLYEEGKFKEFQKLGMQLFPDYVKSLGTPTVSGKFDDNIEGPRTKALKEYFQKTRERDPSVVPDNISVDLPELPDYGTLDDNIAKALEYFKSQSREPSGNNYPEVISRNKDRIYDTVANVANEMYPFLRPSNARPLDPRQLAGEMYALSTNQVEPVQAQTFQPDLSVPYDISLQDQLNANQADYRAAQRMMGYNPAAQSLLNAQKYQANQQVLGEQFRMNQAMKDNVFRENRNILNESKLQNLGILDQQYARQQQALSNTKATTQAALNSITDKYAKNQLENRQLQTFENMYNYRYDPRFRAINMNPLQMFDVSGEGALARSTEREKPNKPKSDSDARNGKLVQAIKRR